MTTAGLAQTHTRPVLNDCPKGGKHLEPAVRVSPYYLSRPHPLQRAIALRTAVHLLL